MTITFTKILEENHTRTVKINIESVTVSAIWGAGSGSKISLGDFAIPKTGFKS